MQALLLDNNNDNNNEDNISKRDKIEGTTITITI
jgi:hypothetical protein